jgi:hypothetical protein
MPIEMRENAVEVIFASWENMRIGRPISFLLGTGGRIPFNLPKNDLNRSGESSV